MSEQTYCPYCGAGISAGSSFCTNCGNAVEQDPVAAYARKQATPVIAGARAVRGRTVGGALPPYPVKKRSTYIHCMIWIGLLCVCPVHTFYAGYIGKGVGQIILAGFTTWFLWNLVTTLELLDFFAEKIEETFGRAAASDFMYEVEHCDELNAFGGVTVLFVLAYFIWIIVDACITKNDANGVPME